MNFGLQNIWKKFRFLLLNFFSPRPLAILFLPLTVVIFYTMYWWLGPIFGVNEPILFRWIHKPGVMHSEYLVVLNQIAQLNIHEFTLFEHQGEGVFPFPIFVLMLPALLFSVFGGWAGLLIDAVAPLSVCICIFWLCRRLGSGIYASYVSGFVSLLLLPIYSKFYLKLIPSPLQASASLSFWWDDFPRPGISSIFLFLGIIVYLLLIGRADNIHKRRYWIVYFAYSAFLIQGDLFGGIDMFILGGITAIYSIYHAKKSEVRMLLYSLSLAAISSLIILLPMIYQQLLAHPDMVRRYGVIPLPRILPYFEDWRLGIKLLTVYLIGASTWLLVPSIVAKRSVVGLVIFSTIAFFGLPISSFILGKGVQIDNFGSRFNQISSLSTVIFITYLSSHAYRIIVKKFSTNTFPIKQIIIGGGVLFFIVILSHMYPVRYTFVKQFYADEKRRYEKELFTFLKEVSADKEDQILSVWGVGAEIYWMLLNDENYLFTPNPFWATVEDAELERRFILHSKLLGISQSDFGKILDTSWMLNNDLSHNKYQATCIYSFSNPNDYTNADTVERIQSKPSGMGRYFCWELDLPTSERKRLMKLYEDPIEQNYKSPDLVLVNKQIFDKAGINYNPKNLQKSFENPVYIAYIAPSR